MADDYRQKRIKAIAVAIVSGQMERGEIEQTEEAMRAAVKEAVETARAAFDAAEEYLCA
jgi:hypothetical protein